MLNAVEGLGSVGEEEETWVLLRVAVVQVITPQVMTRMTKNLR